MDCVRVVGGGSRSNAWMQIMANVFNRPVIRMEKSTGAAYGIAWLAAQVDWGSKDLSSVNTTSDHEMLFEPDPEIAVSYIKKYHVYKKIHDALKQLQTH